MRRILIATVMALAVTPGLAYAQAYATDKGSITLGGTASFTSSRAEIEDVSAPRVTSLTLAPRALFFLAPGLAVGGEAALGHIAADGESTTTYGLGPAVTYYFGRQQRSWYPFVAGSVHFTHVSGDRQLGSDFRDLRASAGLLFLLSGSVGINSELFVSTSHTTFESPATLEELSSDTRAFGLAIGIAAFIF